MFTRSDRTTTERGRHPGWLAALGLLLLVTGLAAPSVADRLAGGGGYDAGAAASGARYPAFVVEPRVVLEEALPVRHSAAGLPVRLVVPVLGVDAPVVPIRAPDGVLVPPSDPQVLGWWSGGARPGAARGGAVITGHTVHTGGGAFDELARLAPGDRVRVRTSRGVVRYVVAGVTVYRKASLARDAGRVFSQSAPGRLVLVTCEDWNGSVYLSNAVVFADPLSGS